MFDLAAVQAAIREFGFDVRKARDRTVVLGDHDHVGSGREKISALAKGLADQTLDAVTPYGFSHLARDGDPEASLWAVRGGHQQQEALGVDAPRPVPNKAELEPLAQAIASRKMLRTLGSGARGSRSQGGPAYFL